MSYNPMLAIDAYKLGHMTMYPKGTKKIYINMIPRNTKRLSDLAPEGFYDGKIVSYGTDITINEIVNAFKIGFFNRDLDEVITEFRDTILPFVGDNDVSLLIENVINLHKLGYLPLEVKCLPEGTVVPAQTPLLTVTNTHEDFAWLPNYLETLFSNTFWKISTAATIARIYRTIFDKYAEETCDNNFHVTFQGHDFSARGMSGTEDSIKTGTGHLVYFQGSDAIHSSLLIKQLYKCTDLIAASVPATEHSVMCLGSSSETETETFRRLITQYDKGIISIVSDTWDFWDTISVKARELKNEILARKEDSLGLSKVVFRPDSGNPVDVICGTASDSIIIDADINGDIDSWKYAVAEDIHDNFSNELIADDPMFSMTLNYNFEGTIYEVTYEPDLGRLEKTYYYVDNYGSTLSKCKFVKLESTVQQKGAIEVLWDIFGGTINDKGFKVLNPKVGLIYGDSITTKRAVEILEKLKNKGFASSNIVLGIGSYTYNYVTRDTLGFAIKATYAEINDVPFNIAKDPKTDSGKKSRKGLLQVKEVNSEIVTNQECTWEQEQDSLLGTVFIDGVLKDKEYFQDIRKRALGK